MDQGSGKSFKQRATSLTGPVGQCRLELERNNYENETNVTNTRRKRSDGKNSGRSGGDPSTSEGRSREDEKDKR